MFGLVMTEDIICLIFSFLVKKHSHCCAVTQFGNVCIKKRKKMGLCTQHYELIKKIILQSYERSALSGQ